jgi:hypothetical protein
MDRLWQRVSSYSRTATPPATPQISRQRLEYSILWIHVKEDISTTFFVDLIGFGDVFFAIWFNDIPTQMNTDIHVRDFEAPVSLSEVSGFSNMQYRAAVTAIRILEHSLRFDRTNNSTIAFPRRSNRRFPSYVKSPRSTDDLIFYSNILPFNLQNVTFNISRDYERATRGRLPRGPYADHAVHHSTSKAVDSDLTTCWHPARFLNIGDFYAIDFLHIQTNVTFLLSVAHSSTLQTDLDVSISFDGLQWAPYRSQKGIYTIRTINSKQNSLHTILYVPERFQEGFHSFRYIKFQTAINSSDRFRVCEVEIIPKRNVNRTLRNFSRYDTFTF